MLRFFFLLLLSASCSSKIELSEGTFSLFGSKYNHDVMFYPIVDIQKTDSASLIIRGKVYLNDEKTVKLIANDLKLSYSKKYYFAIGGDFGNLVKIGENTDTLEFEIEVSPDRDIKFPNLGTDAIGMKYIFKNKTHTTDTSFFQFFDVK